MKFIKAYEAFEDFKDKTHYTLEKTKEILGL